jgi:hypothetical protein
MRASTLPYQYGVPEANSQDVQCYVMLEPHHISEFKPRLPGLRLSPPTFDDPDISESPLSSRRVPTRWAACPRALKSLRKAAVAVAMRDQIGTLDHQQVVALIDGTGPFASNVHSADSHDGRDDGVDFLGRSLFIRLFIAGRFDAHQVAIGLPPC